MAELQDYKTAPFFQHLDYSETPANEVGQALDKYRKSDGGSSSTWGKAEQQAMEFYLMNHISQCIFSDGEAKFNSNSEEFMQEYLQATSKLVARTFYYLLITTTREARHMGNYYDVEKQVEEECGKVTSDFVQSAITGTSSATNFESLEHCNKGIGIAQFVKALQIIYYKGSWGFSFGGKAWGAVTDCLYNYVTGVFTAEVMLDTVWTLCHNNGPIFNKPYLYNSYTEDLLKILDVQRSGQIPQLIYSGIQDRTYLQVFPLAKAIALYNKLTVIFPDNRLVGDIDWYKVEALGGVATYSSYKKMQDNFGVESVYKDKIVLMQAKAVEAEEKKLTEEPESMFVVDTTHTLKKLSRAEL